ncbi:upstrm_HI1419, putative addiction module killer protein [Burkholderiaceae bacterium]
MDTIKHIQLEQTTQFVRWLKGLKDLRAKAAIVWRLKEMSAGHWGDAKSVGGGVSELRLHLGPGYRVYFMRRGEHFVLLIAGGDKSSQSRDIAKAKVLAKEYLNEQNN